MKNMKSTLLKSAKTLSHRAGGSFLRLATICSGAAALVWFLVRVIPKPSRASYPCQRAAFPVASGFVLWLCGVVAIKSGLKHLARVRFAAGCGLLTLLAVVAGTLQEAHLGDTTTVKETLAEAGETVAELIEREAETAGIRPTAGARRNRRSKLERVPPV